jgi:hypothetical protein
MDSDIPVSVLRDTFRFDEGSGKLFWKVSQGKSTAGKEAGCVVKIERNTYLKVTLFGEQSYAHRIVWALSYGYWPSGIDHDDGNGLNNRVDNLREADERDNGRNRSRSKANTSGTTGVLWLKNCRKWRAGIKVDGVYHSLGSFSDIDDAVKARKAAEVQHGFHKNHDR